MAPDDLPTRLHWPADPLNPAVARERADAPGQGEQPGAAGDTPRRVLGEGNDVTLLAREVAELRHAIEEVAERVELRQVRAAIDELRGEVLALRRVVIEWPELEQLATDIRAVRSLTVELYEKAAAGTAGLDPAAVERLAASLDSAGASGRPPLGSLGPVVQEIAAMREEVGTVQEGLDSLHEELVSIRRRIALRGQRSEGPDDDAQLTRVVEAVLARVQAREPGRRR